MPQVRSAAERPREWVGGRDSGAGFVKTERCPLSEGVDAVCRCLLPSSVGRAGGSHSPFPFGRMSQILLFADAFGNSTPLL